MNNKVMLPKKAAANFTKTKLYFFATYITGAESLLNIKLQPACSLKLIKLPSCINDTYVKSNLELDLSYFI